MKIIFPPIEYGSRPPKQIFCGGHAEITELLAQQKSDLTWKDPTYSMSLLEIAQRKDKSVELLIRRFSIEELGLDSRVKDSVFKYQCIGQMDMNGDGKTMLPRGQLVHSGDVKLTWNDCE